MDSSVIFHESMINCNWQKMKFDWILWANNEIGLDSISAQSAQSAQSTQSARSAQNAMIIPYRRKKSKLNEDTMAKKSIVT